MLAAVSPSITDMLRHSGADEAAQNGQVQLVSVAAVRETVGDRWVRHQPLVEDFVTRAFQRSASEDDLIVRVNDTDFLLIQPSRTPMGALSRSSVLLRETLTFFLGAAEAENIHISVVDRIGDDGLEATRVTGDQLEVAAAERTGDLAQSRDGSAPWERFGVARPPRKMVAVKRAGQADIQAMFHLDPVWHVAREAVVSFMVRTVAVQHTVGGVEPVDVASLTPGASAALTIQRLIFIDELLGGEGSGPAIAVHAPISLNALSYSGARTAVLGELRRLVQGDRRERLILELVHLPEGLPESRFSEAIAQVRPYARAVIARAPSLATDVSVWARCGARGVVHEVQAGGAAASEKAMLAALPGAVDRARQAGLLAGLYGVRSGSIALAAWSAGFSHLSGDHITARVGADPVAQRFSVTDLYRKEDGPPA
ncbi:MAG TPA: hypothetical protein VFF66_04830 [Brevundimonas sp.]|nr:hypothetical protein [Brevundimonas sp.]